LNLFQQSTGQFILANGTVVQGYSGHGDGKDRPEMQDVKNVGPLPRGRYIGIQLFDPHPHVGAYAIELQPDPGNTMFGRSGFFIHGDSVHSPGNGSDGCIVMERSARETFWTSPDHEIEVTE
jgi:Protein of unknown function (DUF2778)